MASLELFGFEDLNDAFNRIADIPWSVTEEALDAMADVAAEEIKREGEARNIRDPESSVHILDKITKAKAKQFTSGGSKMITFKGTRTRNGIRTRNAEIAFVNEYGKRGQPARPFIGTAMEKAAEKITAPAERIVGDWIEKEFKK